MTCSHSSGHLVWYHLHVFVFMYTVQITLSAYYLLADLFLNKVYLSPTTSDNGHPTSSDNNPLSQQTEDSNSTILPTGTTLKVRH